MGSLQAWFDNATGYSRQDLRQLDSALLSGSTAARPLGAQSGVTPGIPTSIVSCPTNTTWQVTPFTGVIDVETLATSGPARFAINTTSSGSVNAAHATLDRIDLLHVASSDATQTPATVTYLAGTAASTPTAPATPAGSFPLAQLRVPGGGGAPAVTWVARSAVAAGGISTARNSALYPASPYVGQYIDDLTLGLLRWDGTKWAPSGNVPPTWTSVLTGGANISANTFGYAPAYSLNATTGEVKMRGNVKQTGAGWPSSGYKIWTASWPSAIIPAQNVEFTVATNQGGGSVARFEIGANGDASIFPSGTTNVAWFSLDSCSYYIQ